MDPHRSVLGALRPIPPDRIDAKYRLADATRALIERVALLDAAAADPDLVAAVTRQVETASDAASRLPALDHPVLHGDEQALIGNRSGIAGALNPLAPPLELRRDGAVTHGRVVFGPSYEGPPGLVHGGFLAAAFDELLTSAQLAAGFGGYTGTLTIRMRRPVPLGARVDLEAAVDRIDGRKIHASGVARVDGEVAVEGEIVCVSPPGGAETMLAPPTSP